MPTGNYANWRYSELDQITKDNVKNLQVAWTFSTGVLRGHEGGPLVIGNVMYLHTPFPNNVYALDLNRGRQDPLEIRAEAGSDRHPGDVLRHGQSWRGLCATARSSSTRPTRTVVALDAKTGKEIWKVIRTAIRRRARPMTPAPLIVKDKVIVGISGGEFGVQGRLTAYNLADGKQAWRAYSVGPDDRDAASTGQDDALGKPVGKDSSHRRRWQGDQWKIGGGTTWGWYSYDPELNLIYYGSGNPGTWNPGATARRQQMVDDDLRPGPGHRRREMGLPDDAARRMGL